jgi:hypothetical protein
MIAQVRNLVLTNIAGEAVPLNSIIANGAVVQVVRRMG